MAARNRRQSMHAGAGALGHHPSFKSPGNELRSDRFEDVQNMRVLRKMKEAFDAACEPGDDGELDIDVFAEKFAGMLSYEGKDDEDALRTLFKRIDVNADGQIDWDEFSTFMLLENQGSAKMRETETTLVYIKSDLHEKVPDAEVHREPLTRILWLPSGMGNEKDRYITSSKDGTIRFWNSVDLMPQRTVTDGTAWVTDLGYMQKSGRLIASTFNRTLKIYDVNSMDVCGGASDLESAPFSMDTWFNSRINTEFVVVGDVAGCCILYEVVERSEEDKNSDERYGMSRLWKSHAHSDWISRVIYLPVMGNVLSSSLDRSIAVLDLESGAEVRKLLGHSKGVFCMDWSQEHKFLASGGMDRNILLWNPYSAKSMASIPGHNATICDVVINSTENQIVSLSVDKCIKVWDLRNHRCLQTITDATKYRPEDQIQSILYDKNKRWLLTGTTKLRAWPLKTTVTSAAGGHRASLLAALFSHEFKEIVTVDVDGVVCVWNTYCGKLRFRFQGAHGAERVVAATLDVNGRRLVTAGESGEIKIWNYSSGFCLKTSKGHANTEITAIVCGKGMYSGAFLVTVGWDKKVTFYEDSPDRPLEPARQLLGHRSDILCGHMGTTGNLLVTGAEDGSTFIWSVESGSTKHKLRSPLPGQDPTSIEQVTFLRDRLAFIIATLTAQGLLQLWNSTTGNLLVQRLIPRGNASDTFTSLAVSSGSKLLAIGDSAGVVTLLDMSLFDPAKFVRHPRKARDLLPIRLQWAGHKGSVTCLTFMSTQELDEQLIKSRHLRRSSVTLPTAAQGEYLMTGGQDCRCMLWTPEGLRVGSLGMDNWELANRHTWSMPERSPEDGLNLPEPEVSLPDDYGGLALTTVGDDFGFGLTRAPGREDTSSDASSDSEASSSGREDLGIVGSHSHSQHSRRSVPRAGKSTASTTYERDSHRPSYVSGRNVNRLTQHTTSDETSTLLASILGSAQGSARPSQKVGPLDLSLGTPGSRSDVAVGFKSSTRPATALPTVSALTPVIGSPTNRDGSPSRNPYDFPVRASTLNDEDPPLEVVIDDFAKRKKPPVRPLHERIFLPSREEDRKINFPDGSGRPQSSVAHLIYIQDLKELDQRPHTSYDQSRRSKDKVSSMFNAARSSVVPQGPGGGGAAAGAGMRGMRPSTAAPVLGGPMSNSFGQSFGSTAGGGTGRPGTGGGAGGGGGAGPQRGSRRSVQWG